MDLTFLEVMAEHGIDAGQELYAENSQMLHVFSGMPTRQPVSATQVINTGESDKDYTARIEVFLDGEAVEVVEMPADYRLRKLDVFYRYGLENKKHSISLKLLNPDSAFSVNVQKVIVYEDMFE